MDIVVDTHAVVWYFLKSERLSAHALRAFETVVERGGTVYLASISLVEIVYLVEKSRLPEAALRRLIEAVTDPASPLKVAPLDLAVAEGLQRIPRALVPDMPDRIIAATALNLDVPLVTRDERIRAAVIRTIW